MHRGFVSFRILNLSLLSYTLSLLPNYSLSFLIRTSPKIVKTSPISGQEPRKRYKEDKERRKVGIGKLGGEEERLEVLLSKKILRVKFLEEESS